VSWRGAITREAGYLASRTETVLNGDIAMANMVVFQEPPGKTIYTGKSSHYSA
jgi:hypothetical protein